MSAIHVLVPGFFVIFISINNNCPRISSTNLCDAITKMLWNFHASNLRILDLIVWLTHICYFPPAKLSKCNAACVMKC